MPWYVVVVFYLFIYSYIKKNELQILVLWEYQSQGEIKQYLEK